MSTKYAKFGRARPKLAVQVVRCKVLHCNTTLGQVHGRTRSASVFKMLAAATATLIYGCCFMVGFRSWPAPPDGSERHLKQAQQNSVDSQYGQGLSLKAQRTICGRYLSFLRHPRRRSIGYFRPDTARPAEAGRQGNTQNKP